MTCSVLISKPSPFEERPQLPTSFGRRLDAQGRLILHLDLAQWLSSDIGLVRSSGTRRTMRFSCIVSRTSVARVSSTFCGWPSMLKQHLIAVKDFYKHDLVSFCNAKDVAELVWRLHGRFGSKRRFLVVDDEDALHFTRSARTRARRSKPPWALTARSMMAWAWSSAGAGAAAPADRAAAQAASRNFRMTSSLRGMRRGSDSLPNRPGIITQCGSRYNAGMVCKPASATDGLELVRQEQQRRVLHQAMTRWRTPPTAPSTTRWSNDSDR